MDELTAAGSRFGWDGWVLFPTRDETVCALARHRDELATRFRVPTPGWTAVRSCWDKRETYRLAEELGIAAPADLGAAGPVGRRCDRWARAVRREARDQGALLLRDRR